LWLTRFFGREIGKNGGSISRNPQWSKQKTSMDHRKLRRDEPLAIEFAAALKQGEPERLQRLLDDEPSLACCGRG
jgi:hypothetical protein